MNKPPSQVIEFGDFRLDLEERLLIRADGTTLPLTPRVFETLRHLVNHRGRVLDKEQLMEAVWPDCIVEENNLAQNISNLRRIFGDTPGSHRYIATVPGRGYRFVAEVKTADEPTPHRATDSPASRQPMAPWLKIVAIVLSIFLLTGAGFVLWRGGTKSATQPPPPVPSDKSIAVLPFASLSDDKENFYFAAGIQDEILTRLSQIRTLKVISRGSTQKFNSAPENLREVAQRLGVTNILEGSVQKSGDTVRVTVQLINAQTDTHLWAETYDRKLTDMFRVETEIAQRIATALAAALTGPEKNALAARPTQNFQAYQAYLQGRFFWNKRTTDGYSKAVEQFNRAIELDPTYPQAYVGLADALLFLGGYDAPDRKAPLIRCRAALQKALELDETLAEPHASLGLIAMNIDWNWAEAELQFQRAIQLNANYATAYQWYGEFLAYMGRFEEAIATIARAHELDPLSLIINTDVAKVQFLARRYDAAIAQYKSTLEMDPDFAEAHALLGMAYSMNGQHDEAVAEFRQLKDLQNNPGYLSWQGYVYGMAGRKGEAQSVANQLQDLSSQTYVSPLWMAILYTGMGEKEQAFQSLERVFAEHSGAGAISLKVNPVFDSLRSDVRFPDVLRRAGFN